jgi:hypothetical protein
MTTLSDFESGLDMQLDPGIRHFVIVLRQGGVETFESCEGGDGHAFAEPTVRFHGTSVEGYRAFALAMENGLPVLGLKRAFQVNDGWLEGPWWEMTFRTTGQALTVSRSGHT